MWKRTSSMWIAAAVAISVGSLAQGEQPTGRVVRIDFPFYLSGQSMQPGPYRISQDAVNRVAVRNVDTGHGVFALVRTTDASAKSGTAETRGALSFQCYSSETCGLTQIRLPGTPSVLHTVPFSKGRTPAGTPALTIIRMAQ